MGETQTQRRTAVRTERDGKVAVVVIDNPPVNAGSIAVRSGVLEAVRAAGADPQIEALVLIGAGRTFVAGSDIREFGKPLGDPQLPAVIAAIEACPKPVVAAIHGAALGGGFELALGCDGRIAAPDALVGLPEVTLGLIPGAGGTQRLPRVVGVAAAIEIVTSARRLPAAEAQRLGLIDALAKGDLRAEAVSHALSLAGRKNRISERAVPDEPAERIEQAANAAAARARGRSAIAVAIAAVRNAARTAFADGAIAERAAFQNLRAGEESAALRHLFFAERAAGRAPPGSRPRELQSVGVIGGGTMGSGIAVCFLDAGLPVTLVEREPALLEAGIERIRAIYRRLLDSRRIDGATLERRLAMLTGAIDLAALADVDLVVEAAFEDMAVKRELFGRLDTATKPGAILATNTSYLDVDAIAAATRRPADVVGMHFFAPANLMRLLEVVRADATGDDVLATALAAGRRLGKVSVIARVGEGFIGNRIYSAYRTQCEFMLEEGCTPDQVDAALTGFGMAMGPFAVADLSGLDIIWATRKRLAATRDPRARHSDVLNHLCEAGRYGQKTGRGWYLYPDGARRGVPDPEVETLIEERAAAKGLARRAFDASQIQWRAFAAMINEAALLLAEGIAERASDIDLVMANGYGFPATKGGPLFWASRRPRAEVIAALDALATASGHGFRRGEVEPVLDALASAD